MSNEQRKVGMWGEPQEPHVELELEPRAPRGHAVGELPPGQAVCPGCKRQLAAARMEFSHGALMCKTCIHMQHARPAAGSAAASGPAGFVLAPIAGVVGALVGAGIWATIAIVTELEVGYVAVLVGALAGLGVRWGAGGQRGAGLQVLAGLLAFAGLVAAKYMIFAYVVIQVGHKQGVDLGVFSHVLTSNFPSLLMKTLGPLDALFACLAVAAAARACKPT